MLDLLSVTGNLLTDAPAKSEWKSLKIFAFSVSLIRIAVSFSEQFLINLILELIPKDLKTFHSSLELLSFFSIFS